MDLYEKTAERANLEIKKHGGIRPLARHLGVNPSTIVRAQNGHASPALKSAWNLTVQPYRDRYFCEDPDGSITADVDDLRGKMTRSEFTRHMINWYKYEEGEYDESS